MPEPTTYWSRVLDALFESNRAVLDAVQRGNERGYRFSRRLVTEAEKGQQELVRLRRRFRQGPKDVRGLYQESVDLARRAAGHSAQLASEFVESAGEAGQELRDTARSVIKANRSAAEAMAAALQGAARDLRQGARPLARRAPVGRRAAQRRTRARPQRRQAPTESQ